MPVPGWTDRNAGDPGLVLVALLAWLAVAMAVALGVRAYRRRRAADAEDASR